MPAQSLHELMLEELRDIYHAEKQILKQVFADNALSGLAEKEINAMAMA